MLHRAPDEAILDAGTLKYVLLVYSRPVEHCLWLYKVTVSQGSCALPAAQELGKP